MAVSLGRSCVFYYVAFVLFSILHTSNCFSALCAVATTRWPNSNNNVATTFQSTLPVVTSETRILHQQRSTRTSPKTEVDRISEEPPLRRAVEIAGIVSGTVLCPLAKSILDQGLAKDWDEFWERSNGESTNGKLVSDALERLGPTYVKFGQALASRPDVIPPSLANALSTLQDEMQPFDADTAKRIIMEDLMNSQTLTIQDMASLLDSLTEEPVAAASIGQVHRANLASYGPVAIKVQRPGIKALVKRDALLLGTLATWVESIPALPFQNNKNRKTTRRKQGRLIATELAKAVEEFMDRIFEELDYRNEAANAEMFASLYSNRGGSSKDVQVVVPRIFSDLCTDHILVMEWLDVVKLDTTDRSESAIAENLALVELGIKATLSQLLETGVMHADPHMGNILKVVTSEGPQLGYLDFGLVSTVPEEVRDALVCSVAHLVFDRDVEAVANLCGMLQLLPPEVLEDEAERSALAEALDQTFSEVLTYPNDNNETMSGGTTQVPQLRLDKLFDALVRLVPRFRFQLPPYFLQNVRALSTLEGIARSLDSSFNILQEVYPYSLNRLLRNPTHSTVVDITVQKLIRSPETGRVDNRRIRKLLNDAALLTGFKKRKVVRDVLKTGGGRRLAKRIIREELGYHWRRIPRIAKRWKSQMFRL